MNVGPTSAYYIIMDIMKGEVYDTKKPCLHLFHGSAPFPNISNIPYISPYSGGHPAASDHAI